MKYMGLTDRQAAILDFIIEEISAKGYPPSVREIGEAIGLNSPSTVHSHLATLEQKGYIRRDKSKPRALEVTFETEPSSLSFKEMVDVPILGQVSAGLPIFADENLEDTFPMPLSFVHSKENLFMLRVKGESMIEAGILDGDLVIVEQTSQVRNGEIAVVLVGDEATVKTFYKAANHIRLQPENSSMEPIIVQEAEVLGRVIGLFRRF